MAVYEFNKNVNMYTQLTCINVNLNLFKKNSNIYAVK